METEIQGATAYIPSAIRIAFEKVNENFTEVYADIAALEDGNIVTDVKGNVFAEDSTLLGFRYNNDGTKAFFTHQ